MRKITALALFLFLATSVHAQEVLRVDGAPARLEMDVEAAMNPAWSPDGAYLAFTGPRYEGIWIVRPDGSDLRQVSDEPGAGYGFEWSPDGRALLARVSQYDGPRRLNAVKVFDVETGEERLVTAYRSRMPTLPHWMPDGGRAYLFSEGDLEVFDTGLAPAAGKAADQVVLLGVGTQLARADLATGAVEAVSPLGDAQVLNLALSPDGARAVFEVMGGNMHVMNVDGTGLTDLGTGYRPQWSPDGAYIVYMRTEDDGHAVTASDLYAVRADGTGHVRLTDTPERLEMNPAWSPDGRWIAFDSMDEEALFLLPVAH